MAWNGIFNSLALTAIIPRSSWSLKPAAGRQFSGRCSRARIRERGGPTAHLKKKAVQRFPSLSVHEAARLSSPSGSGSVKSEKCSLEAGTSKDQWSLSSVSCARYQTSTRTTVTSNHELRPIVMLRGKDIGGDSFEGCSLGEVPEIRCAIPQSTKKEMNKMLNPAESCHFGTESMPLYNRPRSCEKCGRRHIPERGGTSCRSVR